MIINVNQKYVENALKLFEQSKTKLETRENSWYLCHNYFSGILGKYDNLADKEKDFACLQLGFYLASWGMFRNSFISQYDYKFYDKVLKVVLNDKYSLLWNVDIETLKTDKEKFKSNLVEISQELNKTLNEYRVFYNTKSILGRKDKDESQISQTLITKILLGVLACCPAYDTYFIKAVKFSDRDFYNDKKFDILINTLLDNKIFAELSKKYNLPIMKVVDIAYFQIGLEKEFKTLYEEYIVNKKQPTDKVWARIRKALKDFYQSTNINQKETINVAFDCDKKLVDEFINANKKKLGF